LAQGTFGSSVQDIGSPTWWLPHHKLKRASPVRSRTCSATMSGGEDRYVFHVEWFDGQADVLRRYMLTYYPRDNSIEMYDPKNKRPFLKRSEYAEVSVDQMYIGSVMTVLARQLKIVDYADEHTRKALEAMKGRTLAIIKPDAYNRMGDVIDAVHRSNLVIAKLKMVRMDMNQAREFCNLLPPEEGTPETAEFLTSDVIIVMDLIGKNAVDIWASVASQIQGTYGTDAVRNAVHGSSHPAAAAAEIEFFFGPDKAFATTALFNNCTLCVVRPHAFTAHGGSIVSRILAEGFEISAMQLWHLDKAGAEEFLEIYKGVLPEYHDMVAQLCTGPALVMEVRQEDAVNSFRKLVGPHDPEVAKHLRPKTLRAQYGIDRVRNAVHCTDLPEDGLLEVEYFFNILYKRS